MAGLLSPQELVALQQDTNYLGAGIPVWGSRVVSWSTMIVLIYHTETEGYIVSDITDLPATTIDSLMQQSDVQGMWAYLPQSIQQVITERVEDVIELGKAAGESAAVIAQRAATVIGQTVANLVNPVVGALTVPLIIGVAIGLIYLIKKG